MGIKSLRFKIWEMTKTKKTKIKTHEKIADTASHWSEL
jgi:hypothetical protein